MESTETNIELQDKNVKEITANTRDLKSIDSTEHNLNFGISSQNFANIRVSTASGLFFLAAASIPQPITNNYLKAMEIEPENAGLIMSVTSLTSFLGAFIINYYLNVNFKLTFLVCNAIAALNFILYGIAGHFKSFAIIFIGRFIYGFGNSKIAARKYILGFVSENQIKRFSLELTALSAIGMSVGPLLDALVFWMFPAEEISPNPFKPSKYAIAGYTAASLMVVHGLGVYFYFKMEGETQEVLEENFEEEEFEVNLVTTSVLCCMFFLVECGMEILFVLFSYYNFEVEEGYFSQESVNIIDGTSNLVVFTAIYLIREKIQNLRIVSMILFFSLCAFVFSLVMGPFLFTNMIKFVFGFKLMLIALAMVES